MNPGDPRSRRRIEQITAALKERDTAQWELADRLVIGHHASVAAYVNHFLERDLAHVVGWSRRSGNGPFVPVLRLGKGESVPKPAAKTRSQIRRDAYQKLKKDPEKYERHLRGQRALRRVPPKPDEWLSWVFRK